jgi:hypothetical protein
MSTFPPALHGKSVPKSILRVSTDPENEEKRGSRNQGQAAMKRVKSGISAIQEAREDVKSRAIILEKVRKDIAEVELERDRYKALAREEHQRNRVMVMQSNKVVLEAQAEQTRGFFLTSLSPRGINYTPENTIGSRSSLSRLSLSKATPTLTQAGSPRSVVSSQSHRLLLKS